MEPPDPVRGPAESAKSVRLLREDELRIEGGEPRRYIRLGHDALAKVAAAWQAEREEKQRLEEETDEATPATSEIGRRRRLFLDPGWTLRLARVRSEIRGHHCPDC